MKTIYKYVIDPSGVLEAPSGAKFLSVAEQREDVCVWALVDPNAATTKYRLGIVPTGLPIDEAALGDFLGTVLLDGGSLVFHFFEPVEA